MVLGEASSKACWDLPSKLAERIQRIAREAARRFIRAYAP